MLVGLLNCYFFMIKFLKTLLFIVIMIFSFALGVKYSHLFLKGDLNIFNETDILFDDKQANQNTDVNNQEETEKIVIEEAPAELSPLTDEEKNDIENLNAGMPDFEGIDESTNGDEQTGAEIDVSEPMDGINNNELENSVNSDNSVENNTNNTVDTTNTAVNITNNAVDTTNTVVNQQNTTTNLTQKNELSSTNNAK